MFYKTLQIRNLQQINSKLVSLPMPVTKHISLDKTLAYYGIRKLQILKIFYITLHLLDKGFNVTKLFTAVIYEFSQ